MQLLGVAGGIDQGCIQLGDQRLSQMSDEQMEAVRGNHLSMIFQEPMTSLNPVFTIGTQIAEPIIKHQSMSAREAREKAAQLLAAVGIASADKRLDDYPHQLSGGMRQRVMIAMALACEPQLLIADEPTTALDVTIQAQILQLLQQLQTKSGLAILLITHDFGVVAELAQRVVVMYAGQIVEVAPVEDLLDEPLHPYTGELLRSIPALDYRVEKLSTIPGTAPPAGHYPGGCRFHPRCPLATERCAEETQELREFSAGRLTRCWQANTL